MALPQGFSYHPGYLSQERQLRLLTIVRQVVAEAPFYVPAMPVSGKALSVSMTNCGSLGWMTDKSDGYRYQATHPVTGLAWPPMPAELLVLWREVSCYPLAPEACLINYYLGSSRLGSHRDADEQDMAAPVVSVSLGDEAVFHVGGLRRSDPKQRMTLRSGDVVVLGGEARRAYHGVDRVVPSTSSLLVEGGRINLTLRRVTLPTSTSLAE